LMSLLKRTFASRLFSGFLSALRRGTSTYKNRRSTKSKSKSVII
jgi:hypothetical protein